MSSGLFQVGFETKLFIKKPVSQIGCVESERHGHGSGWEVLTKDTRELHYGKCRIPSFGARCILEAKISQLIS